MLTWHCAYLFLSGQNRKEREKEKEKGTFAKFGGGKKERFSFPKSWNRFKRGKRKKFTLPLRRTSSSRVEGGKKKKKKKKKEERAFLSTSFPIWRKIIRSANAKKKTSILFGENRGRTGRKLPANRKKKQEKGKETEKSSFSSTKNMESRLRNGAV